VPHVPPPLIALGFAGAQHLLAPEQSTGVVRRSVAAGVAGTSLWLVGGSVARFRSRRTTVHPLHPDRATTLVTDGPNAITRNPMYVGMAGLLVAHALARGGLLTLLPVAGFVAVIDRVQIAPEEAAMERLFGEEYAAYQALVRRWL
jgi:protein-S-isoprenylcysteine O-methyltransferase Ste14